MKSMCQEVRRNSPSVADCRPMSSCVRTTSRIASSSTARSASAVIAPAARSWRAWSSFRGRSRLPTWSARNGGRLLDSGRLTGPSKERADLATGYELDIIASAVVGGASLTGGRGSVVGAVLGTLIFGVLRNALPQIPGATFYDRLIVGVVVVVIVVVDQFIARKGA